MMTTFILFPQLALFFPLVSNLSFVLVLELTHHEDQIAQNESESADVFRPPYIYKSR